MTYIRHSVYLTENQLKKLKTAGKTKKAIKVRIDPTIRGNYNLYLTEIQIKKLQKDKNPKDLFISKTQLEKNGGFIFTIMAILAGIGAAAGIASSVANVIKAVQAKNYEDRMESEANRHNEVLEGLLKKGQGVYIPGKKI